MRERSKLRYRDSCGLVPIDDMVGYCFPRSKGFRDVSVVDMGGNVFCQAFRYFNGADWHDTANEGSTPDADGRQIPG